MKDCVSVIGIMVWLLLNAFDCGEIERACIIIWSKTFPDLIKVPDESKGETGMARALKVFSPYRNILVKSTLYLESET